MKQAIFSSLGIKSMEVSTNYVAMHDNLLCGEKKTLVILCLCIALYIYGCENNHEKREIENYKEDIELLKVDIPKASDNYYKIDVYALKRNLAFKYSDALRKYAPKDLADNLYGFSFDELRILYLKYARDKIVNDNIATENKRHILENSDVWHELIREQTYKITNASSATDVYWDKVDKKVMQFSGKHDFIGRSYIISQIPNDELDAWIQYLEKYTETARQSMKLKDAIREKENKERNNKSEAVRRKYLNNLTANDTLSSKGL